MGGIGEDRIVASGGRLVGENGKDVGGFVLSRIQIVCKVKAKSWSRIRNG